DRRRAGECERLLGLRIAHRMQPAHLHGGLEYPVAASECRTPAQPRACRGALDVLRTTDQVEIVGTGFAESVLVKLRVFHAQRRLQPLPTRELERPAGFQVGGETMPAILAACLAIDTANLYAAGDLVVPPGEAGDDVEIRAITLHARVQRRVLRIGFAAITGPEVSFDPHRIEAGTHQPVFVAPGVESDREA